MKAQIRSIGVFDSGLGGLTVFRELRRALPNTRLVYLGDTARTPYGSKSAETIQRYSLECAHFLLGKEVDAIVVACNTASALALETLRKKISVPVIGTIDAAVTAAGTASHVAVIGTEATIASQVFQNHLKARQPNCKVTALATPLFVPFVECGMWEGEILDLLVKHYLEPLKEAKPQKIILGCTHYPVIRRAIEKFLGGATEIVECSTAVATEVQSSFNIESSATKAATNEFFVTDAPSTFNQLARLFLDGTPVQAVVAA